jgi:hypothetical protein
MVRQAPGPMVCSLFTRAPSGTQQQLGLGAPVGETSRTSKPRPARARRWGVPARTRAHRERGGAHRERRGAIIVSVPLLMQHEDGGHQAAASLTPVPGSCMSCRLWARLLAPLVRGCWWVGLSHAPASHPASSVAPCPPDSGSPTGPFHVVSRTLSSS